ncbi:MULTISPECIES: VOC family protein [unclassified Kitasatospora]|uniref:VOC family protein n=1 Tax=unclassified Kitasatospora TaxID=2633591 RepID=UPI001FD7A4E2|nr:VOC family protein [Kitasatospora sp. RG8]
MTGSAPTPQEKGRPEMSDLADLAPEQNDTGFARLAMVTIDCADPVALAAFYGELLGWETRHVDEHFAILDNPEGGSPLGFGRVAGYRPEPWTEPDGSKHFHLDFYVDDLDEATARALALGATEPQYQHGRTLKVLIDPAGHPFGLAPLE